MPIGCPSQRPEPKSACRPVSRPIEAISCAEFAATGSLSTRWFHGFDAGKTGQPAIVGEPAAPPPPSARAARIVAALERIEHRAPARSRLEQPEEDVAAGCIGGRDPELGPDEPRDLAETAARGDRAGGLDPVGERQAAPDRAHPAGEHGE